MKYLETIEKCKEENKKSTCPLPRDNQCYKVGVFPVCSLVCVYGFVCMQTHRSSHNWDIYLEHLLYYQAFVYFSVFMSLYLIAHSVGGDYMSILKVHQA